MSEQLYREAPGSGGATGLRMDGSMTMRVVPVEPCEHGNIDGHWLLLSKEWKRRQWCPGAGIGDTDER